jgi:hypothetical protein
MRLGALLELGLEVFLVEGFVEVNFFVTVLVVVLLLVEGLTMAHMILH